MLTASGCGIPRAGHQKSIRELCDFFASIVLTVFQLLRAMGGGGPCSPIQAARYRIVTGSDGIAAADLPVLLCKDRDRPVTGDFGDDTCG